jgi:hypothetical protein
MLPSWARLCRSGRWLTRLSEKPQWTTDLRITGKTPAAARPEFLGLKKRNQRRIGTLEPFPFRLNRNGGSISLF